jgi:hypothetical protein
MHKFFGEFANVVKKYLDDSSAEAERIAEEKIAKARITFESRFRDVPEYARKGMFSALIAGQRSASPYDEADQTCPACNEKGIIAGNHDVDWQTEYDDEGNPLNGYPVVTLYAALFYCPICDLELNYDEELKAAGIPTEVLLENLDFHEAYERELEE